MSYKSLVKSQVRAAFRAVGDLAIEATPIRSKATEFDFGTLETVVSSPARGGPTKAVVLELSRSVTDKSTSVYKLLFDLSTIPNLSEYDQFVIDGKTWNVVESDNNGYTATVTLAREDS